MAVCIYRQCQLIAKSFDHSCFKGNYNTESVFSLQSMVTKFAWKNRQLTLAIAYSPATEKSYLIIKYNLYFAVNRICYLSGSAVWPYSRGWQSAVVLQRGC